MNKENLMKRRAFLGKSSAAAAAVVSGSWGCREKNGQTTGGAAKDSGAGGEAQSFPLSDLEKLKKQYEYDLYEDFLPFMEKYVIDHEFGGFMCNTDRDGTNITRDKNTWYEGRGIWVYSFLYNNLARESKYLDVAAKSAEFILKHTPSGDGLWPSAFSREGVPKGEPDTRGYGDLFVAGGLAEFARASGEKKYFDLAKETIAKVIRLYDREDYQPDAGRSYLGKDAAPTPGARVLGVWMVLVNTATQMLDYLDDAEIRAVADRALEAIMTHHHNPDFDLLNEILNHDMSRPKNEYGQFSYTGHAIETLWMVLYEAARRKDKALFDLAARRFKRHVEVAWDDVYGGAFRSLDHVDKNIWKVDKVLWLQEEVLIGSLFIAEHTGSAWARDIFNRMNGYIQEKFTLKQYGFPLWILSADRKVTFERHASRVGNFHHPRHLMLNLLAIQRMLARRGKISGLFV
jgi:mannose/cellobiose epimerase-like protein (N-acyl-D-glucosamine 2-epimerase family)